MKEIKLTREEKKKLSSMPEEIKAVKKSTVELVEYTIKAVIPTGAYANIQPEITVKAKNLEDAEAYIIPHINKLFENFLNKSERRDVIAKVEVKETPAPKEPTKITVDGEPTGMVATEFLDSKKTNENIARITKDQSEPLHSIPYEKAKKAIDNCMSLDALEIIKAQVVKSTKLTENEKNALLMVGISVKERELESGNSN